MEKYIEIASQIAWIGSLIIAIVALFLIKPIYNHYINKNKTSNNINEHNTWNVLNINWDYINQKIITTTSEILATNNNQNGE